jgi:hypothetical protein
MISESRGCYDDTITLHVLFCYTLHRPDAIRSTVTTFTRPLVHSSTRLGSHRASHPVLSTRHSVPPRTIPYLCIQPGSSL